MIYEKALKERDRLERRISEVKQEIEGLPEGKLFCVSNGKYYKWYCSDGHNQVYIPKRKRKLAEKLVHMASRNKRVRSKSEVMIDMVLTQHKIPFRYECALQIGETMIYPDFTIRHPKTGKVYYWEHFGMMDNPSYRRSTCMKLQNYISNGVIPTVQLITTYETKEKPLELDAIEKVVEEYFL